MYRRWFVLPIVSISFLFLPQQLIADNYEPPTTYYTSASGTGATLLTQLRTIVSSMTGQNYGNARYSAPITDVDPNNSNNVLLIYNRASVTSTWDSGATWNREHIWPQSRLGASASNGSTNIASDQFNLRPANPSINSSRSNKPFGMDSTTGANQHVGSYYYPGDTDQGDVARSQFYMATRYSQLSLTDATPSGLQMGDLSSLVAFHYRDVPDSFERRRNHAIYGLAGQGSPAITNSYKQSNRNPYVDHPEYVWSVFVDQQNDSQLYVGGVAGADGGSIQYLNFGSVLVGAALPAAQNVTLTKSGQDGTYYEVTTSGLATSTVAGRMNAFPVITSGTSSKGIAVGLSTNTATAGLRSGAVTINNLDITSAGGAGKGANDGNDTVNLSLNVLDHANPSFSSTSDTNSLIYDLGTIPLGSAAPTLEFDIANLVSTTEFTAGLELDSILGAGDTSVFSTDLITFMGGAALDAGASSSFTASMSTAIEGLFSTTYTLNFSDEDLPGAIGLGSMTLTLMGAIETATIETADFDGDGDIDGRDFLIWQRGFGLGDSLAEGDANGDMVVNELDLGIWQDQYAAGSLVAATAVPEPSTCVMSLFGITVLLIRQSTIRFERRETGHKKCN